MSLFSTPVQTTTAPPAPFSFGGLGGTAASTAASTATGFALPTFATPTPTTTAAIGLGSSLGITAPNPTVGLGGLTQAQPPAAPEVVGLGGTSLNYTGSSNTTANVTKPKDTQIPAELMEVITSLKDHMHHNKRVCDEMTTNDLQFVQKIDKDIKEHASHLAKTEFEINGAANKCCELKDLSRGELLQAEMVLRRQESIPIQYANQAALQPTSYLESACLAQERQVLKLRNDLLALEDLIQANVQGTTVLSAKELVVIMQRMDELMKSVAEKVHINHDRVVTVKEQFRVQRAHILGQSAPDPFNEKTDRRPVNVANLRGPDPFSLQSRAAILADMSHQATAPPQNAWNNPVAPVQTSGLFGNPPPASSLFSTPLTANKPTATGLFGSTPTSNLFKPLQTTSAAAPLFGTPTTSTNTSSLWGKLSSPFNSTSSGTLFGGPATIRR